jgi:hypothetical protein
VVTDIRRSCSCIDVTTRGGKEAKPPIAVKAGQSLPLRLLLHTLAAGDRTQSIVVKAKRVLV